MDARKTVTCIRYAFAGIGVRATADGVFTDGDASALSPSQLERLEKLLKLAHQRHRALRAGRQPAPSEEPKWIDITEARTT